MFELIKKTFIEILIDLVNESDNSKCVSLSKCVSEMCEY